MISLIFDTETTGFIKKKQSVKSPDQPYLVELAFELYCSERNEVMSDYSVIIDCGVPSSEGALAAHGITLEMTQKYGVKALAALAAFNNAAKQADRIVGHNLDFDMFMMQIEYTRLNQSFETLLTTRQFCTMHATTDICKLPGRYGKYKWPKLDEAYRHLVDKDGFASAHRAKFDVMATRKLMVAIDNRSFDA